MILTVQLKSMRLLVVTRQHGSRGSNAQPPSHYIGLATRLSSHTAVTVHQPVNLLRRETVWLSGGRLLVPRRLARTVGRHLGICRAGSVALLRR